MDCSIRKITHLRYLAGFLLGFAFAPGYGEVTLDGSLGVTTNVSGPDFIIDASVGRISDENLFHSFGSFNINTGESATFTGPDQINRIIGRVTGGQMSRIDGAINSTIPGADLYLINPQGITFGPNATFDVNGGLHLSSADYLRFADGFRFVANPVKNPALSSAPITAFGFLDGFAGNIEFDGTFINVSEGNNIDIIGGDVSVQQGLIAAPGGRILIASGTSSGEISADNVAESSIERWGEITINQSSIDVSRPFDPGQSAGSILVRGGHFVMKGGNLLAQGNVGSGTISVESTGGIQLAEQSIITNRSEAGDTGDILIHGHMVAIEGNNVDPVDDTQISNFSGGDGRTGNIEIQADQRLSIDDGGQILNFASGGAQGGDIILSGTEITIRNNGYVSTENFDQGDGGQIDLNGSTITVQNAVISTTGVGRSGDINIQTDRLLLDNGGRVGIDHRGATEGGAVTVIAAEAIQIVGQNEQGNPSALVSQTIGSGDAGTLQIHSPSIRLADQGVMGTDTLSSGRGGDLSIEAERLELDTASVIRSIAFENSKGSSGNITVEVDQLEITGGAGVRTRASGQGQGGAINITAHDSVRITGISNEQALSEISANTAASGNGGSIAVTTPLLQLNSGLIQATTLASGQAGTIQVGVNQLEISQGGQINASTGEEASGNAGFIQVSALERIDISGQMPDSFGIPVTASGISSSSFGRGEGNTIDVRTLVLNLDERGTLQTLATGQGTPGDIVVNVRDLHIQRGADIDASNEGLTSGEGGHIDINATGMVEIGAETVDDVENSLCVGRNFCGGIYSIAKNNGVGGNVNLQAGRLQLLDGGIISAESTSSGTAGNLSITVQGEISLTGQSAVATRATQAGGGNINISNNGLTYLLNSEITARAEGVSAEDAGGNVTITNTDVLVIDHSQVLASAVGGNGGNINISTDVFLSSPESMVNASSELGVDGIIDIASPVTNIGDEMSVLPDAFMDTSALLSEPCGAQAAKNLSSFIVRARRVTPLGPDDAIGTDASYGLLASDAEVISAMKPIVALKTTACSH